MQIRIKKLKENAVVPTYGTEFSAGADLYACLEEDELTIFPHRTVFIGTGLAFEIPAGYAGFTHARSGLASKKGLAPANKVGVIDSDYRGELIVALHNHSETPQLIKNHERIAQLVIAPYVHADFQISDSLSDSERGSGGFGSTGA